MCGLQGEGMRRKVVNNDGRLPTVMAAEPLQLEGPPPRRTQRSSPSLETHAAAISKTTESRMLHNMEKIR